MEAVLCIIGVVVVGVALLVALGACKVSSDISEWERRDGR